MKQQYLRDIFAFANTAAGKVVAVVVALLLALTLSPLAMAAGDLINEANKLASTSNPSAQAGEGEGAGAEGEGANTEGSAGEGQSGEGQTGGEQGTPAGGEQGTPAGGEQSSPAGNGEGQNGENPSGSTQSSEGEGAQNQEGQQGQQGSTPGEGQTTEGGDPANQGGTNQNDPNQDDPTNQDDPDIDQVIKDTLTQEEPEKAQSKDTAVDQVKVYFSTENCSITLVEQGGITGGEKLWQQDKDLVFTVVPNSGYKVESVTMSSETTAIPVSYTSESTTYTIPAADFSKAFTVHATATEDPDAVVQDPTPTNVCDETIVNPDGTFEAPVIHLQDMTRMYIGFKQPTSTLELEYTVEGLQEGDELIVSAFEGGGKDAGTYTVRVAEYWIKRTPNFDENTPQACMEQFREDVTAEYQPIDLSKATATLTIEKAPLVIVTPSASKPYDGTPLTYAGEGGAYDVNDIEWLLDENHMDWYDGPAALYDIYDHFTGDYFKVTGSQTEIGRSVNTAEIRDDVWQALQKNYNITTKYGTLRVTAPNGEIVLSAPTDSKMYDGKPLTLTSADILYDGLPEGFRVQAKVNNASRTDAGRNVTSIDQSSVKILDASGKDVTNAYKDNLVFANGEIYIEPAVLYVVTFDGSKAADGTPLTAGGDWAGLVNGETATLQITGSQTGVGSSTNTFRVVWDGTAKQSNYRVVGGDLGTLTVTAATPTTGGNGGNGGNGGSTGGGTAGAGTGAATGGTTVAGEAAEEAATDEASSLDPTVEAVATGLQNAEQIIRGEEPTDLIAPAAEETLGDEATPLGVFDAPVDCWVHWYAILGLLATAIYGGVVMFFRRAYAYELECREANILGVPVGLAQPQVPAGSGGQAGRQA